MLTLHPCVCMRLERRYVRIRGVTKWRATASKHGRLRAAVKTWKLARKKAAEGGAQGVAQRPAEDGATTNDEEMRKYVPQERGAWTTTRQNDMANWEKLLSKEFCDTFNNKAHLAQIQFTPCLHTKAKTEATVVKMAAGLLQRVRAKRLPQPLGGAIRPDNSGDWFDVGLRCLVLGCVEFGTQYHFNLQIGVRFRNFRLRH